MTFLYKNHWLLQIPDEILQLLVEMRKADGHTVLEIGYNEGALHQLFTDFGFNVLSVDVNPSVVQPEHKGELIIGNSHDRRTWLEATGRRGWFAYVFIDGDHSYNGCKDDIEMYGRLAVRLLVVDDYNCADVKRACDELLGKPDILFSSSDNPKPMWNGIAIWVVK